MLLKDYDVRNYYSITNKDIHSFRITLYNFLGNIIEDKFINTLYSNENILKLCKDSELELFSIDTLNDMVKGTIRSSGLIIRGDIVEALIREAIASFEIDNIPIYQMSKLASHKSIHINSDDKRKIQIDVLFTGEHIDKEVYLEVKFKDNHDNGKNKAMVDNLFYVEEKLVKRLEKEVESYICFLTERGNVNKKGVETLTGNTLFQKLFGLSIDWISDLWNEVLNDIDFQKVKENAYNLIDEYFYLAAKDGRESAYNSLISSTY